MFLPRAWLSLAIRPAQSGVDAEVPPITSFFPLMTTRYPIVGLACAATSGTPLPGLPSGRRGTSTPDCHAGLANMRLTPPPVPYPAASFQAISLEIFSPDRVR